MQFVIASYSLNGTFLGLNNLTDQLQLCGGKSSDVDITTSFLNYGTSFENKCTVSLLKFFNKNDVIFYDLYIVDKVPTAMRVLFFWYSFCF